MTDAPRSHPLARSDRLPETTLELLENTLRARLTGVPELVLPPPAPPTDKPRTEKVG